MERTRPVYYFGKKIKKKPLNNYSTLGLWRNYRVGSVVRFRLGPSKIVEGKIGYGPFRDVVYRKIAYFVHVDGFKYEVLEEKFIKD